MSALLAIARHVREAVRAEARGFLDAHCSAWVLERLHPDGLPRELALELLERLGERLGAKIEVNDLP